MNGQDLGILLQAKLDLQKTVQNINADLLKLSQQIKSLNLNIDTSNLTKDINQQIDKFNKQGRDIQLDTNLDEMPKEITDVGKFVENLKKQFNVSSASIKRDVQLSNNQMKSLLVTLKQVDGVTRSIRLTPTADSPSNAIRYRPEHLTVNDRSEEQSLKNAEKAIALVNKNREQAEKLFKTQQKTTAEIKEQIELYQRQARINVKDLQRRYGSVLTENDNKQIKDYLNSVNQLDTTMPNVGRRMKDLSLDFKSLSSDVKSANTRVMGFGEQLKTALTRIPVWVIGLSAFYAPLRGLQDAAAQIQEVDKQLIELKRVMDAPSRTFEEMLQSNIDLAAELGNEIRNINEISIGFARQGYSQDQIRDLTRVSATMQNISETTAEESYSALTAAMKGFNIEASNSVSIVDKLNEVDKFVVPYTSDSILQIA